jgi:hypothetical protein
MHQFNRQTATRLRADTSRDTISPDFAVLSNWKRKDPVMRTERKVQAPSYICMLFISWLITSGEGKIFLGVDLDRQKVKRRQPRHGTRVETNSWIAFTVLY